MLSDDLHYLPFYFQGGPSQRGQSSSLQQKSQVNKSSYGSSPYWANWDGYIYDAFVCVCVCVCVHGQTPTHGTTPVYLTDKIVEGQTILQHKLKHTLPPPPSPLLCISPFQIYGCCM